MLHADILTETDFWATRLTRARLSMATFRRLMRDYLDGAMRVQDFLDAFLKPLDLNEEVSPAIFGGSELVSLCLRFAFDDGAEFSEARFKGELVDFSAMLDRLEAAGFPLEDPATIYYPQLFATFENETFLCEEVVLLPDGATGVILVTTDPAIATRHAFQPAGARFEREVPVARIDTWWEQSPVVTLNAAPDQLVDVAAESADWVLISADRYEVVPRDAVCGVDTWPRPRRPVSAGHPYRFPQTPRVGRG